MSSIPNYFFFEGNITIGNCNVKFSANFFKFLLQNRHLAMKSENNEKND